VLLEGKRAVIYGAGGVIGGAVATAFAREGAAVFLAGRTEAGLTKAAETISAAGGVVETAQVDVLDEAAVDDHAERVARAGGISHGDLHGTPLAQMSFDHFARPLVTAIRAQFLTARAAARHMQPQGSGVILAITATTARLAIPNVGGTAVTFDAIESLCRHWARELGPRGIRVLWLRTTGIPEAFHDTGEPMPDYGAGLGPDATVQDHVAWMKGLTMLNRLTTLDEVGKVAAFVASDHAASMTGCAVNLSAGSVRE
jgi:3-oxoacyl-[acyl-carrier protein] reductase